MQDLVTFRCEDATGACLDGATVVFMYLLPRGIKELWPTLAQLAPGTRVVSYIFKVPFLEDCASQTLDTKHTFKKTVTLAKPGRDRGEGEHSRVHIYSIGAANGVAHADISKVRHACSQPCTHVL